MGQDLLPIQLPLFPVTLISMAFSERVSNFFLGAWRPQNILTRSGELKTLALGGVRSLESRMTLMMELLRVQRTSREGSSLRRV